MAESFDFNLEGLEKFLSGIEKLKDIGEQFATSMGTTSSGRSKAAQEMRAEQLKILRDFTQIMSRTARTYKLQERQQEAAQRADISAKKRHTKVQDLAFKQEEAFTKRKIKEEDKIFKKKMLREETTAKLSAQRRVLKFGLQAREQRFAQTTEQYESMSELRYQRLQSARTIREEERALRQQRAYEYETRISEEARARRKKEREERESEKQWRNVRKTIYGATRTALLAPFKLAGNAMQLLWKKLTDALGALPSIAKKGIQLVGGLVSDVSGSAFTARMTGSSALTSEYLGSTFKGMFNAPDLLEKMATLRANPLDIAYPLLYGKGSAIGASPNEKPESAMMKLTDYLYKMSRQLGPEGIGLEYGVNPLMQMLPKEALLAMSRTPEAAYAKRREEALRGPQVSEETLQTILDFDKNLNQLGVQIKGYFANKLAPVFAPLERLGTAFVGLFDNLLTDDKITAAIDFLVGQLNTLSEWLKKDETHKQFEKIWNDVTAGLKKGWDFLATVNWEDVGKRINQLADIFGKILAKLGSWYNFYFGTAEEQARGREESEQAWYNTLPADTKQTQARYYLGKDVADKEDRWDLLQQGMKKFTDAGFTPDMASGAMAQAVRESSLNPRAESLPDPKTGEIHKGLFQWNSKRRKYIKEKYGIDIDTASYLEQIDAAIREFKGPERHAYQELMRAGSAVEAGQLGEEFERTKERGKERSIRGTIAGDIKRYWENKDEESKKEQPGLIQQFGKKEESKKEQPTTNAPGPQSSAGPSLMYPNRNIAISLNTRGMIADPNITIASVPGAVNGGAAYSNGTTAVG